MITKRVKFSSRSISDQNDTINYSISNFEVIKFNNASKVSGSGKADSSIEVDNLKKHKFERKTGNNLTKK